MSSTENKSILLSPLTLRGVTFKNRIGVSPMCQYTAEDGMINDWHLVNYGSFATGGAGFVTCEATGVEPRGRITHGCPGLWKDEQIEPWTRVTRFLKAHGCVPGIQLAHAGRKASAYNPWQGRNSLSENDNAWETVAPSAIPFAEEKWQTPRAATIEDIDQIKAAWVSAAHRAVKAGFEVIELHFAHGYLISTFLSPITNQRDDHFGGSLENRMRLGLEITENIRKAIPENIVLGVRVSVTDYTPNGWDLEQATEFAKELKKIGCDFVDCSSGGVTSSTNFQMLNTKTFQLDAAAKIQREAGIPTAAVGKISQPLEAEEILKQDGASLILVGRAFLDNPHWAYLAADLFGDEDSFNYPPQYEWCIGWKAFSKWRNDVNQSRYKN